jgi:hypothetical protein
MSTRFNIPKIYQSLKLADYAPEFGEAMISVWVNAPSSTLNEYSDIIEGDADNETKINQVIAWLVTIWRDVSIDEVKSFIETSMDTDPRLWRWMLDGTFRLIKEHRIAKKKD